MFGLSTGHLLILAFVILLLFGSRRLPELGSAIGKSMRAFKKGLEGNEVEDPKKLAQKKDDDKPGSDA